jgi:hypothetical protein
MWSTFGATAWVLSAASFDFHISDDALVGIYKSRREAKKGVGFELEWNDCDNESYAVTKNRQTEYRVREVYLK